MRRTVVVMLLVVWGSVLHAQQPAPLAVGTKAIDFTLTDAAGRSFRLSDGYGKQVSVLAFSRFACSHCRDAMRDLQRLQQRYNGDCVSICAVNLDGPQASWLVPRGLKQLSLTYPVLLDPEYRTGRAYRVDAIPYLLVIDPDGVIRYQHSGQEPDLAARLTVVIDQYRPAAAPPAGQ